MKINPLVIMREEPDHTGMVFDPDTNKILTLNSTGVVLWKAFASGDALEDAVQEVVDKFSGIEPEKARTDAVAFVNALREKGLLMD